MIGEAEHETDHEAPKAAEFLSRAIQQITGLPRSSRTKVLDFGCGTGSLAGQLAERGYDAWGCDVEARWGEGFGVNPERLSAIALEPYRLPYESGVFDVVVSTSVLEHAQNKEECFRETHRVLRNGGYAMHLYPGKWYLPREPHIFVPLANFFWPRCPGWWLGVWAILGVRNGYQQGKSWRETLQANVRYCREELSYWPNRRYRQLSLRVFGNYAAPMKFYVENAYGGYAKLFGSLPFKSLSGWLSGELRMNFIVLRKQN